MTLTLVREVGVFWGGQVVIVPGSSSGLTPVSKTAVSTWNARASISASFASTWNILPTGGSGWGNDWGGTWGV